MKRASCFLLLMSSLAFAVSPAVDKAHKASLHIGQETVADSNYCSATAIGPQAILTATHCELPDDTLYVEGRKVPLEIVRRMRDGNDHTIYLIKGTVFSVYANVSLTDPVEVSEDVFIFGNPGKWSDVYQKGYIASIQVDNSIEAAFGHAGPDTILIDLQAFPGESGAGIFNTSGEVIAVLGFDCPQTHKDAAIDFAGAYPLAFKQADIDKARSFSTPVEVHP